MPDLSKRAAAVKPFLVMDMLREATQLAASGHDILHMEAGQPSGPPPRKATEAAEAALRSDRIGYTESLGLPALRERIARHYREQYGVEVAPERIVITPGSSGSFILSFLAAFDEGARVGLTVPGYPAYRNILSALDIETVALPTGEETRWAPTPASIAALADGPGGLDGLLVANPANPTGTMLKPDTLAELVSFAARRNLWFISDEIYHGLNYTLPAATALSTDQGAIVINSFSKYYCMTGWRVGWMIVPPQLARSIESLAQNLFICAPTLSQYAAIGAFDAVEELEERKAQYAANRAYLLDALPGIGIDRFTPVDGAFYIYMDVSRFTNDSTDFAARMLRDIGVSMAPGADFDRDEGKRYLRASFAGDRATIKAAIGRLKGWLGTGRSG